MLNSDLKNVLNHLILHLSTHKDRVLAGLCMLMTQSEAEYSEEQPLVICLVLGIHFYVDLFVMYRVNSFSLISLEFWPSLVLGWLDLTTCLMDRRLSWYGY